MRKRWTSPAAAGLAGLGAVAWSAIASNVDTPNDVVENKSRNFEIPECGASIVADAMVEGKRDKKIQRGFGIIADYIFGNNLSSEKVGMTAPVTQQSSEKIAMTAHVTQQATGKSWPMPFTIVPVRPDQLFIIPVRKNIVS